METKQETQSERSFELRSEKVRSIVGQVPSSLVQHGITVIAVVLVVLFAVARFLPYKQVYAGEAIVRTFEADTDSVLCLLPLRFDVRLSNVDVLKNQPIELRSAGLVVIGLVDSLSGIRDTAGWQIATCRFAVSDLRRIENQRTDFQIVTSSGNLLQKMLGGI